MKHSMAGTCLTNDGYTFSLAYFKSIITGKLAFLPCSSYTNCSNSIPERSTSLFFGEGMFHLESEWPPQEARCYLCCKSHQLDKAINHCRKIPQWALSSTSDIWQPNTSGQPACSRWAPAAAGQNLPLLPHRELRQRKSQYVKGGWKVRLPCILCYSEKIYWGFLLCWHLLSTLHHGQPGPGAVAPRGAWRSLTTTSPAPPLPLYTPLPICVPQSPLCHRLHSA